MKKPLTMTAEMKIGPYDTRQPSVLVELDPKVHHRQTRAILHMIAAHVETMTLLFPPANPKKRNAWVVVAKENDSYGHKGRVYLELAFDTDEEALHGLSILQTTVNTLSSAAHLVQSLDEIATAHLKHDVA